MHSPQHPDQKHGSSRWWLGEIVQDQGNHSLDGHRSKIVIMCYFLGSGWVSHFENMFSKWSRQVSNVSKWSILNTCFFLTEGPSSWKYSFLLPRNVGLTRLEQFYCTLFYFRFYNIIIFLVIVYFISRWRFSSVARRKARRIGGKKVTCIVFFFYTVKGEWR